MKVKIKVFMAGKYILLRYVQQGLWKLKESNSSLFLRIVNSGNG